MELKKGGTQADALGNGLRLPGGSTIGRRKGDTKRGEKCGRRKAKFGSGGSHRR